MSERSPALYCTLILIAMQGHQTMLLLFFTLTFSVLVANPKKQKLLYTVANPARVLPNREN